MAFAFKMSIYLPKPLICFSVLFPICFVRHEVVNINLRNKPEWYFTKHPFGQIPVLENSKCQLIYESVIACEYLDDAYPGRKLYPYDPYERARQKMLLELFYKVYPFFFFFLESHLHSILLYMSCPSFDLFKKSNH